MTTLLARLPGCSKTEAIEHAISSFLTRDAVEQLKALAGNLDLEDASVDRRRHDRSA